MGFAQMIGFMFVFCLENILNKVFFSSEYFFRSDGRALDFIIFMFYCISSFKFDFVTGWDLVNY